MKDQLKNGIIIAVISVLLGCVMGTIIGPYTHDLLFFKPEIEIIDVKQSMLPSEPSTLNIIRGNSTITKYYSASLPCFTLNVKNKGKQTAVVEKVTIELLGVIPSVTKLEPFTNVTITLNASDIYSQINLTDISSLKPHFDLKDKVWYIPFQEPYSKTEDISPAFAIKPNEVCSFNVIVDSNADYPTSFVGRIIVHYDHKTVETEVMVITIQKTSKSESTVNTTKKFHSQNQTEDGGYTGPPIPMCIVIGVTNSTYVHGLNAVLIGNDKLNFTHWAFVDGDKILPMVNPQPSHGGLLYSTTYTIYTGSIASEESKSICPINPVVGFYVNDTGYVTTTIDFAELRGDRYARYVEKYITGQLFTCENG